MKMKKSISILLIFVLVFMTGCSQKADGNSTSQSSQEIWTAAEMPIRLRYDRRWEYSESMETDDPEMIAQVVEALKALKTSEITDEAVDDFTDILTFTFADGSKTELEFEGKSWVSPDDTRYHVEGISELRNLLRDMMNDLTANALSPVPVLVLEANGHIFYADLQDSPAAEMFIENLSKGMIELELHDNGSFGMEGTLPWDLVQNEGSLTVQSGDVILFQGDRVRIKEKQNLILFRGYWWISKKT